MVNSAADARPQPGHPLGNRRGRNGLHRQTAPDTRRHQPTQRPPETWIRPRISGCNVNHTEKCATSKLLPGLHTKEARSGSDWTESNADPGPFALLVRRLPPPASNIGTGLLPGLHTKEARSGSDWTGSASGEDSGCQRRLEVGQSLVVGACSAGRENREACGPGKTGEPVPAACFCQTAPPEIDRYPEHENYYPATDGVVCHFDRLVRAGIAGGGGW